MNIREMRQRINRAANGRERLDGKELPIGYPAAPTIRAVLFMAERDGLSGEDAMTALAYHALIQYEQLYDRFVEHVNTSPRQYVIAPKATL